MENMQGQISLVHVRYEGRSYDLAAAELGIFPGATDHAVREAIARFLEVPVARLALYVVERYNNGNIRRRRIL